MQLIYFFILLTIAITPIFSSDQEYLQFCFKSKTAAEAAVKKIQFLKTKSDYIGTDNSCIDITTSKDRVDLYNKVMRVKFGLVSNQGSFPHIEHVEPDKNACKFQLMKITKADSTRTNAGATQRGVHGSATKFKGNNTEISGIIINNNSEGRLNIRGQDLKIHCRKISSGYQIKLSLNSQNTSLETERFIPSGGQIELGSISQIFSNDSKKISSNPNLNFKDKSGQKNQIIYLRAQ